MGDFLRAAEEGLVPKGSVLIVENLDRLTRQNLFSAMELMKNIICRGITLVTLNDGQAYTEEAVDKNPLILLSVVVMFMLGNQESAKKGERLKESWSARRARARDHGTPLTSRIPGWLKLNEDRKTFFIIKDRATIVHRIFELVAAGKGIKPIAEMLNREGVERFGGGKIWYTAYVAKIADSAAAMGTLVPHVIEHVKNSDKKVLRALEPVPGYYPAVVDEALFARVRAMRERPSPPTRNSDIKSMLAGLATCPKCGGRVTRISKGPKTRPSRYLVCMRAKMGGDCTYKSIRQDLVEQAIIAHLPMKTRSSSVEAEESIRDIGRNLDKLNTTIANFVEQISIAPSHHLSEHLQLAERMKHDLVSRLEGAKFLASPLTQKLIRQAMGELTKLVKAEPLDINRINGRLRQCFSKVEVDVELGELRLHWRGTDDIEIITFMAKTSNPIAKAVRTPAYKARRKRNLK